MKRMKLPKLNQIKEKVTSFTAEIRELEVASKACLFRPVIGINLLFCECDSIGIATFMLLLQNGEGNPKSNRKRRSLASRQKKSRTDWVGKKKPAN